MLLVVGAEEDEVISLLEQWTDETQGFLQREALMESDQSTLEGQDLVDSLALEFLLNVKNRSVD